MSSSRALARVGLGGSLVALLCCGGEERPTVQLPVIDACNGLSDGVLCSGGAALTCLNGNIVNRDACRERGLTCANGEGCRTCAPNRIVCDGNKRFRCDAEGSALTLVEECNGNLSCSPGGCFDLCGEAAKDSSYLGCDYWPVFTSNSQLSREFNPAVSIGNGNLVPAHVVITRGDATVGELDVEPTSARTIELSYDDALRSPAGSSLMRGGAYHLRSNVPVTVHQFNPLRFELEEERECTDDRDNQIGDQHCYSYTNDASLLLPSTALGPDYIRGASDVSFVAFSRSSFMARVGEGFGGTPGFVAITAVGESSVRVRVESTAFMQPSSPLSNEAIPPLMPGEVLERELAPGDVLQLATQVPTDCPHDMTDGRFCDRGAQYDLTGTRVHANGPIQVISGHDCANVPFDRVACDHLEESMTPVATWGTSAVISVPRHGAGGEYVMRVFSEVDGNQISFDPPVHEPVTLARGQVLELLAQVSVYVRGTGPLNVAQYLIGQGLRGGVGDPSLSMAVTVDQYRQSYEFMTPESYQQNVIDIIASEGDVIMLDGNLVTAAFEQVGQSAFRVASVPIERAGAHTISGTRSSGFGIVLYGLGSYTSYMMPGGLDLDPLIIGY